MLLESCSWMDVEARLARDRRVVIVLGATEEHSDLSLATDTLIPWEIARRACDAEDALLAPAIPFSLSTWSAAFPGTISLRAATLALVLEDAIGSLARSGFRRFFILNGHGLNRALYPVLGEIVDRLEGAAIEMTQWWELEGVREALRAIGLPLGHANWSEAFPFTRLGAERRVRPSTVAWPSMVHAPADIRLAIGEGHAPGPTQVDDATMTRVLDAAVESFRRVLRCSI